MKARDRVEVGAVGITARRQLAEMVAELEPLYDQKNHAQRDGADQSLLQLSLSIATDATLTPDQNQTAREEQHAHDQSEWDLRLRVCGPGSGARTKIEVA